MANDSKCFSSCLCFYLIPKLTLSPGKKQFPDRPGLFWISQLLLLFMTYSDYPILYPLLRDFPRGYEISDLPRPKKWFYSTPACWTREFIGTAYRSVREERLTGHSSTGKSRSSIWWCTWSHQKPSPSTFHHSQTLEPKSLTAVVKSKTVWRWVVECGKVAGSSGKDLMSPLPIRYSPWCDWLRGVCV